MVRIVLGSLYEDVGLPLGFIQTANAVVANNLIVLSGSNASGVDYSYTFRGNFTYDRSDPKELDRVERTDRQPDCRRCHDDALSRCAERDGRDGFRFPDSITDWPETGGKSCAAVDLPWE